LLWQQIHNRKPIAEEKIEMTEYSFNTKLSKVDFDLYQKLWVLLKTEGRNTFSADDFRAYNLDMFIEDTQHGIGSLFAKWKINKLIEPTGQWKSSTLPSNHGHKQQLFKMKGLEVNGNGLRTWDGKTLQVKTQ
jgi:hypothetical protein